MSNDIYEWAEAQAEHNEAFVGEVIDNEKKQLFDAMDKVCRKLEKTDQAIKYRYTPINNRSKNGMLLLDFPKVYCSSNKQVLEIISTLLEAADDFGVSTLGDKCVISFGVQDIWSEFHYDE